jgi:hypothetical protein
MIEREALKEAHRFLVWALERIEAKGDLSDPLHEMNFNRAKRAAEEIEKLLRKGGATR